MLEWACECDHRSRGSSNKAKTEKCSTIVSLLTIATPMISATTAARTSPRNTAMTCCWLLSVDDAVDGGDHHDGIDWSPSQENPVSS